MALSGGIVNDSDNHFASAQHIPAGIFSSSRSLEQLASASRILQQLAELQICAAPDEQSGSFYAAASFAPSAGNAFAAPGSAPYPTQNLRAMRDDGQRMKLMEEYRAVRRRYALALARQQQQQQQQSR
ncbi:hypothetical protein GGI05_005342 [Coemansia sp. RSA 2603]|nr:hypothetical protein GGI05_005342 [Coemansia sp. RSA 2603]